MCIASLSECKESDHTVRLFNETYSYEEEDVFVTGIPQTCVAGTWSSLCNDAIVPDNTAEMLCSENGYRSNNYRHIDMDFKFSLSPCRWYSYT